MKIIKHGTQKNNTRKFVCNSCGCVFEAENNEYEVDFSQTCEEFITTYYTFCPECRCEVFDVNVEINKFNKK